MAGCRNGAAGGLNSTAIIVSSRYDTRFIIEINKQNPSRGWGGTLVVSPTPIHGQWLAELQQHSGLKVEVYYGLQWHRHEGDGPARNRQVRLLKGRQSVRL